MDPIFSQQFAMPEAKPKGGMFGGNAGNIIAAALAGFMQRQNPQGAQSIMQMMADKRKQALEEAQYNRQRADKRDDFTFEQDYRAQHQEPSAFTQEMLAAGIDPNSPDGVAAYKAIVANKTDPVVMTPQGPMLRSQLLNGGATPAPPGVTFTPVGGQTPPASGGFPPYYPR